MERKDKRRINEIEGKRAGEGGRKRKREEGIQMDWNEKGQRKKEKPHQESKKRLRERD